MVASPPHYHGLGGWASIRKGMYLRRRPAMLFKHKLTAARFTESRLLCTNPRKEPRKRFAIAATT